MCDKAHEILADTSSRFIQFREGLLAIDGKADAKGLTVFCKLQVTTMYSR